MNPERNIDLLTKIEADGLLKQLLSRGLLPLKISFHMEVYRQVMAEMNVNGGKKRRAVKEVSDRLDIHENTIWSALRLMSKEG